MSKCTTYATYMQVMHSISRPIDAREKAMRDRLEGMVGRLADAIRTLNEVAGVVDEEEASLVRLDSLFKRWFMFWFPGSGPGPPSIDSKTPKPTIAGPAPAGAPVQPRASGPGTLATGAGEAAARARLPDPDAEARLGRGGAAGGAPRWGAVHVLGSGWGLVGSWGTGWGVGVG